MKKESTFYFKNRQPIAPLKIIAMENCRPLIEKVDKTIVDMRRGYLNKYSTIDPTVTSRGYDTPSYLAEASCPRFGSGEAKGVIHSSVRGSDLFIISDVTNNSMSFKISGQTHYYSPDDHFQDLKRIIAAAMTSAHRVSVIMPFLYMSRQHKRENRESLDCAVALNELKDLGVANIITFDAHDPRVMNAIPTHDLDDYSPIYQLLKALERKFGGFKTDKDELVVIAPHEGAMSRGIFLANNIGVGMGMFYKRKDYTVTLPDGRHPTVELEYLGPDVENKTVLILDDLISTGTSMLEAAASLKERKVKKVIMAVTFPLFTEGLEEFDKAYEDGVFDYLVSTNLIYHTPQLNERPWFIEADLSVYLSKIIDTMNHNVAVTTVISPTAKLQELILRNSKV